VFTGYKKIGRQITNVESFFGLGEYLIAPAEGKYRNGLIVNKSKSLYFSHTSLELPPFPLILPFIPVSFWQQWPLPATQSEGSIKILDASEINSTNIVIDARATNIAALETFSIWDNRHTYFVDFGVT